jgi:hypothetical protein
MNRHDGTCTKCAWFSGRPDDVCTLYDALIEQPEKDGCSEWVEEDNQK